MEKPKPACGAALRAPDGVGLALLEEYLDWAENHCRPPGSPVGGNRTADEPIPGGEAHPP